MDTKRRIFRRACSQNTDLSSVLRQILATGNDLHLLASVIGTKSMLDHVEAFQPFWIPRF